MKYLLFLLVFIILTSCDTSVEIYDDEQCLKYTTIEITEAIDSNYQVSIVGDEVYLLDSLNLVRHKSTLTTNTDLITVTTWSMILFLLLCFLLLLLMLFLGDTL